MVSIQDLQVQKKREVETKEEATIPARVFLPKSRSKKFRFMSNGLALSGGGA